MRKVNTRFMSGNKDNEGVVFNVLMNAYGKGAILSDIDFDNAIYSNGFVSAIESGLIPELEIIPSFMPKKDKEYHHVIINDECYIMYFN